MIGNGAITYDTFVLSYSELKIIRKKQHYFTRIFITAPRVNAKRDVYFYSGILPSSVLRAYLSNPTIIVIVTVSCTWMEETGVPGKKHRHVRKLPVVLR